jgi:hypothetical protein
VQVDPACPATLLSAARAHPALELVGRTADAELAVDCGATDAAQPGPRLRFVRGGTPTAIDGPLLWSASVESSARRLGSYRWRAAGQLEPAGDGDRVLLAAGATPLILRRANGATAVIETSLEVERGPTEDPAATPLLFAFLVDEALSASLLDDVARSAREPDAVMVVPRAAAGAVAATEPTTAARETRGWSRALLLAALLALLWELAVLLRRVQRERREAWPQ